MTAPAIEVTGVSKRFGRTQSLDALDLSVPSGAVFGLLGPNGAGKTTTLRILLGLLGSDEGTVRVLGLDPKKDGQRVRESVGVLLENDGLYDRLSAIDNLDYHARIRRLGAGDRKARIQQLLESFGLWDRRDDHVVIWSKGMRQKLAVARAFLHRPQLLLLDEPFTGLDPAAAVDLRARLVALAADEGVSVLLTTHDLAHVERSCTEVAVLRAGAIIARGAPHSLGKSDGALEVDVAGEGLTDEVLAAMQADGLLCSFQRSGTSARVTCDSAARARLGRELLGRGVELVELHTAKGSLEEAFLSILAAGDKDESC